jgi:hypothetical protein
MFGAHNVRFSGCQAHRFRGKREKVNERASKEKIKFEVRKLCTSELLEYPSGRQNKAVANK